MRRLLLAALLALPAAAGEDAAREALAFAHTLFHEGDFYRAITEYKRAAFLSPGTTISEEARLGVGLSYQAGGKWEPAAAAFKALADEPGASAFRERACFEFAETFRRAEEWYLARDAFRDFLKRHPASAEADRARLRLAACLARLEETEEARRVLGEVPASSPLREEADRALEGLSAEREPRKSPALAGTLSAVLPGSGQWYAGRPLGGAAYFLLNAAFIGGAVESFHTDRDFLGSTLAVCAAVVYAGNVYGAVADAHKANAEADDLRMDGIERRMGMGELAPAPAPAFALVWTVRF